MADFQTDAELQDFNFAARQVTRNDTGEPFVHVVWQAPGEVVLDESTLSDIIRRLTIQRDELRRAHERWAQSRRRSP